MFIRKMLSIGGIKKLSSPFDNMFQKSIGKHPKGTDPLPKPNLTLGSQLAVPEIPKGVNVEALRDYTPQEIKETLARQRRIIKEFQDADNQIRQARTNAPKNAMEEFFKMALAEARLKKVKEINNSYLLQSQKEQRLAEELNKLSNIEGSLVKEADEMAEDTFREHQSAREVMSGNGLPSVVQTADPMGQSDLATAMEKESIPSTFTMREFKELDNRINEEVKSYLKSFTEGKPLNEEEIKRLMRVIGYSPSSVSQTMSKLKYHYDRKEGDEVIAIFSNFKRYLRREYEKQRV